MRPLAFLPILAILAATACEEDAYNGELSPAFTYTLTPTSPTFEVGQDTSVKLTTTVMRSGTDTSIKNVKLLYTSANQSIALVDTGGTVTGVGGGSTTIKVTLGTTSIDVPVTVRAHPATSIEFAILTPVNGGIKTVIADTGTMYALPADPLSSRLRAVVKVGNDTVYCLWCGPKTPVRTQRLVRFRSLNTALATVSNAANPLLQTSTDTSGKITARDTSTAGVKIVLEIPGDGPTGLSDTVTIKLALRPIDTIRMDADSNFFPASAGGLTYTKYPNSDTTGGNVVQSTALNFKVNTTFLGKVQRLPTGFGTTITTAFIAMRPPNGNNSVTDLRGLLPAVLYESPNSSYLTVNGAGQIIAQCAFIGGNCPANSTTARHEVLTCSTTQLLPPMPATFNGPGNYTVPGCSPARVIAMPGIFCSTAVSTDLTSTCSVWIRATTTSQVPVFGTTTIKTIVSFYRINIRR